MILVTGAGGVLGHALALELNSGSEPYHLISRTEVDLTDRDATIACFRKYAPRLVYHLAGRVQGLGGNMKFPAQMYVDNIRINTNVVEAASIAKCAKIVAASTVATYNSHAPMPVKEASIWDGPPHPSEAAYGHAKRAMLAQLEAYAAQEGLDFAYPILTNLYGPHDRFDIENGHVVPSLVAKFHRAAVTGEAIQVWGSGIAKRDFIMSADAARALILIANKHSGPINVATGTVVKIHDLVDRLADHVKVVRIDWDPSKPDGQLVRSYDISKLSALGFQPTVSLRQGIAITYDWYANAYPNVRT